MHKNGESSHSKLDSVLVYSVFMFGYRAYRWTLLTFPCLEDMVPCLRETTSLTWMPGSKSGGLYSLQVSPYSIHRDSTCRTLSYTFIEAGVMIRDFISTYRVVSQC